MHLQTVLTKVGLCSLYRLIRVTNVCSKSIFCIITLYHTIPTFDNPKRASFQKHRGKRRLWKTVGKAENAGINPSKREIIILTFNLSSANAFNLDQAKILLFGKKL